jgi:hypothetical protein
MKEDITCERIAPPQGWEFQDCSNSTITLTRVSEMNWEVNLDARYPSIYDAYVMGKWSGDDWDIYIDEPNENRDEMLKMHVRRSSGKDRSVKGDAVKEIVCLADYYDNWKNAFDRGSGITHKELDREALNDLAACRREFGI